MATRLPSLLPIPIAFAHRGARAHAPENTIEAFQLAQRLGATGMESDVWITADDVAVLDHDGVIGPRFRRRPIREIAFADLPPHIPSLEEYYEQVGIEHPLSLDVKDPNAFAATVAVARSAGAEGSLWLCHPRIDQLIEWRRQTEAFLIDSTKLSKITEGTEMRANRQRDHGIDGVNLRHGEWSGGLVAMFHRFGRFTFGWDAQQPREIANLLDAGIDGLYSDHADRLSAAIAHFFPELDPQTKDD